MKKIVCFALTLVCLFTTIASALALTGTVAVNDYLNVRKTASTSGTIIGYLGNGNTVTVLDGGSITSGFYHINADCYLKRTLTGSTKNMNGYGSSSYIK